MDLGMLAPLKLGTTDIPAMGVQFIPGDQNAPIRRDGLRYASALITPEKQPRLTFSTPLDYARSLLSGFELVEFPVCEWYDRTVGSDGKAAATGTQYKIKTGARALAHIQDLAEGDGGIIVANVEVIFLSGGVLNGVEDIFETASAVTVPAISTEPTYHVRGPVSIGGDVAGGVLSFSASSGNRVIATEPINGKTYPEDLIYDGGERTISLGVRDLAAYATAAGVDGKAFTTDVIVYLREIDRQGNAKTNGLSLTMANGRMNLSSNASVGATTQGTLTFTPIDATANNADPIVIGTATSIP